MFCTKPHPSPGIRVRFLISVLLAVVALLSSKLSSAQTADDGIMLAKQQLCTGVFYAYDYWDHYWEGAVNRTNGNVGTVTTRDVYWTGNYAVTNRLDLIATTPYVWTSASQGVLHGQRGWQDFTLAAKFKAVSVPVRTWGAVRLIGVVSGSVPMSGYTPDLEPLSIGTQSKRLQTRATLNYLGRNGLYLNGTTAYTWRNNVTLQRSSYYTNGQFYLSSQVALPNLFEYTAAAGYRKNDTTLTANYTVQQSRGGGDIRIQDLPFVSNRVNFSKIGGTLTYPFPRLRPLQLWVIYNHTFDGRNTPQSNTITPGFLYTFTFEKRARS